MKQRLRLASLLQVPEKGQLQGRHAPRQQVRPRSACLEDAWYRGRPQCAMLYTHHLLPHPATMGDCIPPITPSILDRGGLGARDYIWLIYDLCKQLFATMPLGVG